MGGFFNNYYKTRTIMSLFISDAVAAAAPAAQQPGIEGMLFPVAILVFFYVLFMIAALKPMTKFYLR